MAKKSQKHDAARNHKPARKAFTLIELLVVMAIIAVLIAILVPAVQKVRDAANRTTCANNLKQIGLAVLGFESSGKRLPSPGEGIDPLNVKNKVYDKHSFFTYILPYIEQDNTYKMMDLNQTYNATTNNQVAAKTQVPTFICPSAEGVLSDPGGYGQTSYMPIAYVDIDPATGQRNKATRSPGALKVYGVHGGVYAADGVTWLTLAMAPQYKLNAGTIKDVSDGTSNTVILGEDAPYRNHESLFPFQVSSAGDPTTSTKGTVDGTPSGGRAINRWAEPENGSGVSGPPMSDPSSASYMGGSYTGPYVNQMMFPIGGGSGPGQCLWSANNCGPNDELSSSHRGGCNVLFLDGHVSFLRQEVTFRTIRYLMDPADGNPVDNSDAF